LLKSPLGQTFELFYNLLFSLETYLPDEILLCFTRQD